MNDSTRQPMKPNPKPTSSRLRIRARVSSRSPSGTASRITRPSSAGTATRYCGGSSGRSVRIAWPTSPRRARDTSQASPTGRPTAAASCESPSTRPSAPTIVIRVPIAAASRGASRSRWPALDSQPAASRACVVIRLSSDAVRSLASVRSIASSVPVPTMTTRARNVISRRLRSELRRGTERTRPAPRASADPRAR